MISAGFDDTIAAIATPPGRGAVAMVRMSGPAALESLLRVCPELGDEPPPPRLQRLLRVHNPVTGELVDRALVTYFPAPRSYTGGETVEFATHGGLLAPQLVLDALLTTGIREALPGEFTRRAVLNGKLDLLQAEAILDLTEARSPALHRAAIHQMERGLSARIEALREEVLRAEALVGYGIDFPDEDEPPVATATIVAAAEAVLTRIETILETAPQGEMLRRGALVVLAGYPNSGKSSLFNALLGLERAIVTDLPGTTRDAVEADVTVEGYPFRLVDTAGLRETTDQVEALGVEVARRYLAAADVVLFCSDATRPFEESERAFVAALPASRSIVVRTKSDLAREVAPLPPPEEAPRGALRASSRTGEGMRALRERLLATAFGQISRATDAPLVTTERHARALRAAADELRLFLAALRDALPPELAATHLRAAADALQELIGAVTTDDVLATIFSRFCVGK